MTRLGTWLVRGSLGETPASVMRRTSRTGVGTAEPHAAIATLGDQLNGGRHALAGVTPASLAPSPPETSATAQPVCEGAGEPMVYNPGPLDDAHREHAGAELDALIGAYNRGRLIAVAVREMNGNN